MNDASVTGAARNAQDSAPLRGLARLGFAVNGLVHILIGSLAIAVAAGGGSGAADQSGAFGQLASNPGGVFLLWTVVIGMFALGLWLLISAFLMRGTDPKRKWTRRGTEVAKAAAYFAIGATAVTFALGGTASSASSTSDASATLLSSPGGVFVLIVAGVIVLAIGAYFVRKGVAQKFTDDISLPGEPARKFVLALGVAGYVSKGIAISVVGILVVAAALTHDASKSTGLDGALRTLAALPFGVAILTVIGIGLIAYGLYCFVRAWRARL
ncbi:DUF1206 domain-containing protein [Cryobacterium algoritolerans]|uniref:DUF1206 domain-containing protein n=1 Tax=Cryobacterium algoritolerans TaxID=1259184 RepID=A0A4R8WIQ2_9MICO|nr:DUF1206 domain-containing protein [Cryobacterium algoritolerans]TFC10449.1 DUF1206 domain-containing protein [Cryobacterium algoritolerans]